MLHAHGTGWYIKGKGTTSTMSSPPTLPAHNPPPHHEKKKLVPPRSIHGHTAPLPKHKETVQRGG